MKLYLDNSATTKLLPEVKEYIISLLDMYYNPSSLYKGGVEVKRIIEKARTNVAKFINTNTDNIIFTSSGSAANTLAIKGLTSENFVLNKYQVFYSPTAHKSMIKACNSCLYNIPLKVNKYGEINLEYLDDILYRYNAWEPLVCIEAANSEIGTINDVISIANIVHKHNGIIIVDATGYIPTIQVDMQAWKDIDILTFSGHKLNSLKGCGVLYKRKDIELKPLIYGSQEKGLFGGTENVLGIAALGKAVEKFDYSSINTDNRDYVYHKLINEVPECYLVGADLEYRLPHNLYMCFKGIEGESLMILLDEKDIQVSTGSACTSGDLKPSATLTAIGLNEEDIHSCIRMSFSGSETKEQLDYLCEAIKNNVTILRSLKD